MALLLSDLELRLENARADLEAARQILNDSRLPVDEAENRAHAAWQKKKSAIESLVATRNAANACGLGRSIAVSLAETRIQTRIAAASREIRSIIQSSKQVCAIFEWAWNTYLAARALEVQVLGEMEVQATKVTTTDDTHSVGSGVMTRHGVPIPQQLREAMSREQEELLQRKRELVLPDDAHYDPQYDDVELLQRRRRPWV
jgi:hypothetical protein